MWLAMIGSGAATTSLLRAGGAAASAAQTALLAHEAVAIGIGALAIGYVARRCAGRASWRVALIVAVLVSGWMSGRTFTPHWAAGHAIVAALATSALLPWNAVRARAAAPWERVMARLAFVAMFVQTAIGGLLRHHVVALPWHLLFAGVAALLLLVSAVNTLQDSSTSRAVKRVAHASVAILITQVCLGTTIVVLELIGTQSAATWIGLTVAHVLVGNMALAAALAVMRVRTAAVPA